LRDSDGKDVQPIVKVLPKPALADLFLQVAVGRGHDSDIDFDRMRRTQALKLFMLNHPEQLGLRLQRQLPDLVQAKGGTVGDFKPKGLVSL